MRRLMSPFVVALLAIGFIKGPSSAFGETLPPKKILKAQFKVNFAKLEKSKLKIKMDATTTGETQRDDIRAQVTALIDGFLAAPSADAALLVAGQIRALTQQFSTNEVPGFVADLDNNFAGLAFAFSPSGGLGGFAKLSQDWIDGVYNENFLAMVAQLGGILGQLNQPDLPPEFQAIFGELAQVIAQFIPPAAIAELGGLSDLFASFSSGDGGLPENFAELLPKLLPLVLPDASEETLQLILLMFDPVQGPAFFDQLFPAVKTTLEPIISQTFPGIAMQLLGGLKNALAGWALSSTAFVASSKSDVAGSTLMVTVGTTDFMGVFDEKGSIKTDTIKAKFTSAADGFKLDISGTALANALGMDSTVTGKGIKMNLALAIRIIDGGAAASSKSGYRVERAASVSSILDRTVPFLVKSKAGRNAAGKNVIPK